MSDLVEKARTLAYNAHDGQYRRGGKHFMTHPHAVSQKFSDPNLVAVALLHDVLESTNVTRKELEAAGMPAEVIDAVVAITRNDGEPYFDYIHRCKRNPLAHMVKIADIRDNLSDKPLDTMIIRYGKALEILTKE